MSTLKDFANSRFVRDTQDWESLVKKELKTEDISSKILRNSRANSQWPVLSNFSEKEVQLPVGESWKKVSQSFVVYDPHNLKDQLHEELSQGTRAFFFYTENLNEHIWNLIKGVFDNFSEHNDLNVFVLGENSEKYQASKFEVVNSQNMIVAHQLEKEGENTILELALIARSVILNQNLKSMHIAIHFGQNFFENIAKMRAAKLLVLKILEEKEIKSVLKFVALTSFEDWTLYESSSNILRNNISIASALMSGADYIQSAHHEIIRDFELKSEKQESLNFRIARNAFHILSLESMLGVVEDPGYGSFHLESLTDSLVKTSWRKMQELINLSELELHASILKEMSLVKENKKKKFNTRKISKTGINDFANPDEKLNTFDMPLEKSFRLSREFEKLRLKLEKSQFNLDVRILFYGDLAKLNPRISFVKNYFEILGIKVYSPDKTSIDLDKLYAESSQYKDSILVLCAADDDYQKISTDKIQGKFKFIAGKVEIEGFKNLFVGQNVLETLETLLTSRGIK